METINLRDAIACGNAAFAQADKAVLLYEQLVERIYALGEDVAAQVEDPAIIADAFIKAAEAHRQRRGGYKLAEKALIIACRILNSISPADKAKLVVVYRSLGHVCCRQGKHCQALKYNTLAALLSVAAKEPSSTDDRGR